MCSFYDNVDAYSSLVCCWRNSEHFWSYEINILARCNNSNPLLNSRIPQRKFKHYTKIYFIIAIQHVF